MLIHQNHATGEENGSIMVGMFVYLCLASKKPSEREFFIPAGTDLGVMLLTEILETLSVTSTNEVTVYCNVINVIVDRESRTQEKQFIFKDQLCLLVRWCYGRR